MIIFEVPIRGGKLCIEPHDDGWRVDGADLTQNEVVLLDGACLLPCFHLDARVHVTAILEGRFNCHIFENDEVEDEDDALDEMLIHCREWWVWTP